MIIDDKIQEYFKKIDDYVNKAYEIANKAKKKGVDPVDSVEIPIADDLAARVEGLVSTLYPKIANSGLKEHIRELEKEYGKNDERVALLAGLKTAQNEFAKYDNLEERIDIGLRVAVAYLTLGVVTAPLEGISQVKIKKNSDGSEYVAVYYAGPIRSAGGTASAVSVLAADFIRIHLGIGPYKPTDIEIKRYATEVEDYYSRVAAKQYHPTEKEIELIIKSVPVEITGDPTEKLEVSNYKDLDRVETNKIRGGMCLVLLDGLPLKAEKLLKRIRKYPKDFKLEHWHWLDDFIKLKTELNAASKSSLKGEEDVKYVPSKKYLSKIIAGRPVFAFPNTPGGFRLRYGRSRTGGLASTSLNNVTIHLLEFTALGTQLAMEGPGKATVVTPCDTIEGPVVRLKDGSVKELRTKEELKKVKTKIDKILSLGDVLIPYGEFVSNGQTLLPSSYVEEWWEQELELKSKQDYEKFKGEVPKLEEAIELSKKHKIPLHPYYNFFWHDISKKDLIELIKALRENKKREIVLKEESKVKETLEILCVPHDYDRKLRKIKFSGKSLVLYEMFKGILSKNDEEFKKFMDLWEEKYKNKGVMELLNDVSDVIVKEKGIHRIGMKMGRPEKSERRLMKGKPQVLFPCGEEGGKMRNLMKSYEHEFIKSDISVYLCQECGQESYTPKCMYCGGETKRMRYCQVCNIQTELKEHCGRPTVYYKNAKIPIKKLIDDRAKKYGITELPELIKGVKGVTGKDRNAELIDKGLLRAKYDLYVNKDGTIRTDASDVPITHFRPREIGVSWKKLKEIGYDKDIYGEELKSDEQLLELLPQDIIISDNEYFSTSEYLLRVSKFVDEELEKIYGVKGFYNFKSKEDLIGHLVIGLAPHTSAGIIGRIIGFTRAKAYLAHPFWHAGKRRNCDGDEDSIMLLMDALLNFSQKYLPDTRGGRTMDAPLVMTTKLKPDEVDDESWNVDVVSRYPLKFYEETWNYPKPWELSKEAKITIIEDLMKDGNPYHCSFTHDTTDINDGPIKTKYVELSSMPEKVRAQLELGEMIRAVDENVVAEKLLNMHFFKDIIGNLRKFTRQTFRCVDCNAKFRRMPLSGVKCPYCGGKIVFTVTEGSVRKYVEPIKQIMDKYRISTYTIQNFEILEKDLEALFGKKDRQMNLFSYK